MQTSFEDFTVFFVVLFYFGVERNCSLIVRHVVVEPMSCSPIAECVSKEIFLAVDADGASVVRTVSRKCRTHDCIKGDQGEDVITSCK